ncbi:tRNA wybutosine-synthesizing protein 2/3/4 isoform X2 [Vitis vinifera]|uniref:tRNA wybutosine-synthesizing protein 2/3/4 isoform X2 n=1 Tax=Vitis vinifera TaxID=29760 RepID=UPI00053F31D4|nr:tRNA wybutosine-synthesizing protein 2/3/4 isoform X2 [Vitis vinifera]|eukprot:XP_010655400.1 PREDICTED: tRNA wybutosine-synthesizing protein 2/3/4 isoform X4 [Vitis vinifera]
MEFEKRKAATLASMGSTEPDKSPKGTIDRHIVPLLSAINRHNSYFTTSSCSGRISILSQPSPAATNAHKKARGGSWLFITHDLADPNSVLALLFPTTGCSSQHDDLVFRFEPFIVAVECKDVAAAQLLVSTAVSCGFRESGITSVSKRVMVAVRCSIRLEVPLGGGGRVLVSPEYVRYLVGIANDKMETNRRRTEGFLQALQSSGFVESFNGGAGLDGAMGGDEHGCSDCKDGDANSERIIAEKESGSVGVLGCSLSIVQMEIIDEPVEKLFLWGHSACTLDTINHKKVIVFGGFGGMGRHARRNDAFVLDPLHGTLKAVNAEGTPSPRLGHTSSMVGDLMFIIGGRADPENILDNVWVLDTAKNEWRRLECTGSVFPPRHRHAAAVLGSKIYVFGGLNNDAISSSLHVLDTDNLQWNEIRVHGEWPCARHSHSLVAYGSKLFMFGGCNDGKALGDLYSFDVQTCLWKKEVASGRTPYARFSHSMFIYKNYLGIIGGCPVRQHCQELALLDLQHHVWRNEILDSVFKVLFVRSTASVVGDDLIMIGGGASCYAFGTKFSGPMKINLLQLVSLHDTLVPSEMEEKHAIHQYEGVKEKKNGDLHGAQNGIAQTLTESPDMDFEPGISIVDVEKQMVAVYWVLQLERKYAKLGKDILKKFGWLDLGRKVHSREDRRHICFPVTEKFCTIFNEKDHDSSDAFEVPNELHLYKPSTGEGVLLNDISFVTALRLLKECGATKLADEVVEVRRTPSSPLKIMSEAVASLIKHRGLSSQLLEQLPTRWERLGDIVVLPVTSFKDPIWDSIGDELWPIIAKSLNTCRLARQGRVAPSGTRDSTLEILVGDNGWVDHCENGILYSFDATKCMFSWGNLSEKLRMGCLNCRDEVIVDLFAGIGYFVLPFLVRKVIMCVGWMGLLPGTSSRLA